MNDEIRNMLRNAVQTTNTPKFQQEVSLLSIIADQNTDFICKKVFEKLIADYQKDPLRSGPCSYYNSYVTFADGCFDKKYGKLTFNNTLGDLARSFNHGNNESIYFYFCISFISDLVYIFSTYTNNKSYNIFWNNKN